MPEAVSSKSSTLYLMKEIERFKKEDKELPNSALIGAVVLLILGILAIYLADSKFSTINAFGNSDLTETGAAILTGGCISLTLGLGIILGKWGMQYNISSFQKELEKIKREQEGQQIEMKSLGIVKV